MRLQTIIVSLAGVLSASAATISVDLDTALDHTWVNSGITVSASETLSFSASGTWTISNGNAGPAWAATPTASWVDPSGPNGLSGDFSDTYVTDFTHGALIAFVGTLPVAPGSPGGGGLSGTGGYYGIGSAATITFSSAGTLWFGINDDRSSGNTYDNQGTLTVNVPDGGLTIGLLGGALLGLQAIRRKIGC